MEAKAVRRHVRSSPRKMRLLIDLIRGKSVTEAMAILHFSSKHASQDAELVLKSAVANLSNREDGRNIRPENMIVKEAFVNQGVTMKRISAAPMGRAYRIRKRSHHLTIVVGTK